jgi:hypothetical protein
MMRVLLGWFFDGRYDAPGQEYQQTQKMTAG